MCGVLIELCFIASESFAYVTFQQCLIGSKAFHGSDHLEGFDDIGRNPHCLARAGHLDPRVLRERYFEELRPYLLSKIPWHDKTLDLWIAMAWPTK